MVCVYWGLRLLALWFSFVDLIPAVFLLPLLLVTTAVLDETLLLFVFAGMFTFVSTTPSRGGFPTLLFARFVFVSVEPHPTMVNAPVSTRAKTKVRRIYLSPLR
jgi:hypothetical protein